MLLKVSSAAGEIDGTRLFKKSCPNILKHFKQNLN
jgi:hypothetical protein